MSDDRDSGAEVATSQFTPPSSPDAAPTTMMNDVTLTEDGAWFTDSRRGTLFSVPVDDSGEPGEFRTLAMHGPGSRHQRRLQT